MKLLRQTNEKIWFDEAWEDLYRINGDVMEIISCKGHCED